MKKIIASILIVILAACTPPAEPGVTKHVLPNGLTLLLKDNPNTGLIAIELLIRRSIAVEETPGINNFVNRMLLTGTTKRTRERITEEIESAGGTISEANYNEFSSIRISIPSNKASVALNILHDIIHNTEFSQEEVNNERESIIGEIKAKEDLPYVQAEELWMEHLYKGHPFERPPDGYIDSVNTITREDLIDHYHQWYTGKNIIIGIVGNLDKQPMTNAIEHLFGDLPPGTTEAQIPYAQPHEDYAQEDYIAESFFVNHGYLIIPATHPDFMPLRVLTNILGVGSGSRLFYELREKQGLAYSIYAIIPSIKTTGFIRISAAVRPDILNQTLEGIEQEITNIQEEPVTAAELSHVKNKMQGFFLLDHQKSNDQVNYLVLYESAGLGYEHDEQYIAKVRNVTSEEIQRVAQTYLHKPVTAIVGPFISTIR